MMSAFSSGGVTSVLMTTMQASPYSMQPMVLSNSVPLSPPGMLNRWAKDTKPQSPFISWLPGTVMVGMAA